MELVSGGTKNQFRPKYPVHFTPMPGVPHQVPSNGVRLMKFDTFLQIYLVGETLFFKHMFNTQLTLHASHVKI